MNFYHSSASRFKPNQIVIAPDYHCLNDKPYPDITIWDAIIGGYPNWFESYCNQTVPINPTPVKQIFYLVEPIGKIDLIKIRINGRFKKIEYLCDSFRVLKVLGDSRIYIENEKRKGRKVKMDHRIIRYKR